LLHHFVVEEIVVFFARLAEALNCAAD